MIGKVFYYETITAGADPGIYRRGGGGELGSKYIKHYNNTGAFPSASVLTDIPIYVSLIRLRFDQP